MSGTDEGDGPVEGKIQDRLRITLVDSHHIDRLILQHLGGLNRKRDKTEFIRTIVRLGFENFMGLGAVPIPAPVEGGSLLAPNPRLAVRSNTIQNPVHPRLVKKKSPPARALELPERDNSPAEKAPGEKLQDGGDDIEAGALTQMLGRFVGGAAT